MALTQMQIIQSLGEAMTWLERELAWGVAPAELRHLMGRIGELYAAMITNGQMAMTTNEKGYDVVSKAGERISVKTTTMNKGSGHISFNPNTLDVVDRVMILQFNVDEMEIEVILDADIQAAKDLMNQSSEGKWAISLSKLSPKRTKSAKEHSDTFREVSYKNYRIVELETGTIQVFENNEALPVVKPSLRKIAAELGLPLVNSNQNPLNTRQLGTLIVKHFNPL